MTNLDPPDSLQARAESDIAEDRRARFNVAFHRTRAAVYLGAIPIGTLMIAVGIFTVSVWAFVLLIVAFLSAAAIYAIHLKGLDRKWNVDLDPIWMASDVVFITLGVALSGGISSPWFIAYLSNAAAVAFVAGRRAAFIVTAANTIAYFFALFYIGDITWFDQNFYLAFFRMLFIAGASYFALRGIANAQEKRVIIRELQEAETRKVDELTKLTRELHLRTRELADANQRIREADRMKSQFLANMSHELRTPLNSIIGFSEILIERLKGIIEAKPISFLEHILASGQHLLGIINDILDLSKIEAGKLELFPEKFQVRPVIESVSAIMRAYATKAKVSIEIVVREDLPRIETDPAKFKQVLYNLLSNAVKFSPPGSTVQVRAAHLPEPAPEGSIAIAVIDRGMGIAPENHSLVFEEFRQVDSTSRREFGGTGLGLALVKKFVELQEGSVTLESALGEGSTFTFTLPVRSFMADQRPKPVDMPGTSGRFGNRVLVVEDDDAAWEAIARHLQSAEYVPIRALHGNDALRIARVVRPIAITLDLVLPTSDGWEVLKVLKADPLTRDIPVVIVSMLDNRELGIALGADDYFVKPVDRDRLVDRIREMSATTSTSVRQLLLIDDDPAVHALLEDELTRAGYQVDNAYSGEEGLKMALQRAPHLIVLDLVMPGMSGFEAADILKSQPETAHIPILVMTSKDLTESDRERLHSKIADLIPKGQTSSARLIAAIRTIERKGTKE